MPKKKKFSKVKSVRANKSKKLAKTSNRMNSSLSGKTKSKSNIKYYVQSKNSFQEETSKESSASTDSTASTASTDSAAPSSTLKQKSTKRYTKFAKTVTFSNSKTKKIKKSGKSSSGKSNKILGKVLWPGARSNATGYKSKSQKSLGKNRAKSLGKSSALNSDSQNSGTIKVIIKTSKGKSAESKSAAPKSLSKSVKPKPPAKSGIKSQPLSQPRGKSKSAAISTVKRSKIEIKNSVLKYKSTLEKTKSFLAKEESSVLKSKSSSPSMSAAESGSAKSSMKYKPANRETKSKTIAKSSPTKNTQIKITIPDSKRYGMQPSTPPAAATINAAGTKQTPEDRKSLDAAPGKIEKGDDGWNYAYVWKEDAEQEGAEQDGAEQENLPFPESPQEMMEKCGMKDLCNKDHDQPGQEHANKKMEKSGVKQPWYKDRQQPGQKNANKKMEKSGLEQPWYKDRQQPGQKQTIEQRRIEKIRAKKKPDLEIAELQKEPNITPPRIKPKSRNSDSGM